jgi:hypothetical protein
MPLYVQTSKIAEQGKPITILIRSTFICFASHTSHGVAICGLAGNIIKPQKQTAKKRLHAVLQHPLPRSVGEVAYTGRRWNTIKLIFLAREDSTMTIIVFISPIYFYNITT